MTELNKINAYAQIDYTQEEREYWRAYLIRYFTELEKNKEVIHPEFLKGLKKLNLLKDKVATIEDLNQALSCIGWETTVADKFIFGAEFAQCLNQRRFPISLELRSPEAEEHSIFPDLIHSILGHLPFLFWKPYRDFIGEWSEQMCQTSPNEHDIELFKLDRELMELKERQPGNHEAAKELQNTINTKRTIAWKLNPRYNFLDMLFVHSLEFGILKNNGKIIILGAAIISSIQELRNVKSGTLKLVPINMDNLKGNMIYTEPHSSFFIAKNLNTYNHLLRSYQDNLHNIQFP